jgi:hypothetical protein
MSDRSPEVNLSVNGHVERCDIAAPRKTYKGSVDSIERNFESINLLAVGTVHRLVGSTDTWLATLEEKHARLTRELDERCELLGQLDRQIEEEKEHAEALSRSAEAWARYLRRDVSTMHSELVADVEGVEHRAHEVSQLIDSMLGSIQRPRSNESSPEAAQTDPSIMPSPTAVDDSSALEGLSTAGQDDAARVVEESDQEGHSTASVSADQSQQEVSDSHAEPALVGDGTPGVTAPNASRSFASPGAAESADVKQATARRPSWSKRVVDFLFPE